MINKVKSSMNLESGCAYICDAVRTPIGRYGGSLSTIRADDLAALPMIALRARNKFVDWNKLDDIVMGCANQAGEDNRNVARMATLLSGLPDTASATTVNRLCGSGMDAVAMVARGIKSGELELGIAGGVEAMSRAPFVMGKSESAFSRQARLEDTTMGWRFVNALMRERYGVDTMPETAENVAEVFAISRRDQDAYAYQSQQRTARAQAEGVFAEEIIPVLVPRPKKEALLFTQDEHPRPEATLERLGDLRAPFRENGTVTAGNASGINDGSCALLMASAAAVDSYHLTPKARVIATATVGLAPRLMGFGPAPAAKKVLALAGLTLDQMDIIEFNEAFASQTLAVLRDLGLPDDAEHVNPNGGAIALGHPLGMSGARLVTTATYTLQRSGGRYALCGMCVGVGQGIAMIIEKC